MRILALDPGTTHTGVTLYEVPRNPIRFTYMENAELARMLRERVFYDLLAEELFNNYNNPIGEDSIQTILWTGIFADCAMSQDRDVHYIYNATIRRILCNSIRVTSAQLESRVKQIYGGGKGTKDNPTLITPVYKFPEKVRNHIFSSLAVATAIEETIMTGELGELTMLPDYTWVDQTKRDEITARKRAKAAQTRERNRQRRETA